LPSLSFTPSFSLIHPFLSLLHPFLPSPTPSFPLLLPSFFCPKTFSLFPVVHPFLPSPTPHFTIPSITPLSSLSYTPSSLLPLFYPTSHFHVFHSFTVFLLIHTLLIHHIPTFRLLYPHIFRSSHPSHSDLFPPLSSNYLISPTPFFISVKRNEPPFFPLIGFLRLQ
jgi:hypothetical protein